jgi:hypothetical protein
MGSRKPSVGSKASAGCESATIAASNLRTSADNDFRSAGLTSVDQSANALPFHGQFSAYSFGLNWNVPTFHFGLTEFMATECSSDIPVIVRQVLENFKRPHKRRIYQGVAG